MGLIKAGLGALGGTLADQWKEFFYCDAMDADTLVIKGQKRTSGRSSNTKGSDNVISDGSGIAVADGQCMIIVEQGKIVDACSEPGQYTYDTKTEPSIFTSGLAEGIKQTFAEVGKRFEFGGAPGKDQRIYYFNTKEIMDNKFGTANPFMFHIEDKNTGLKRDVSLRCNGIYSYRITDPLIFYINVCGNVEYSFTRDQIDSQLKTEFISALQPAFAKLSKLNLLPSEIPAHSMEIEDAMNEALTKRWAEKRGISVVSVAMNPITLKEEDLQVIQKFQDRAALRDDPSMAAATLVEAQAEAMTSAAKNPNGGMMGFMGMGMASQTGGMNANTLYQMGAQQKAAAAAQQPEKPAEGSWTCSCGGVNTGKFCMQCGKPKPAPKMVASWKCSCGTENTGKFCIQCGKPKPEAKQGWTCECGALNQGKFCMECGKPKPADAPLYRCDKCGWEPEDPKNPPKFCPQCGDKFDDNDIQ